MELKRPIISQQSLVVAATVKAAVVVAAAAAKAAAAIASKLIFEQKIASRFEDTILSGAPLDASLHFVFLFLLVSAHDAFALCGLNEPGAFIFYLCFRAAYIHMYSFGSCARK